MDTTTRSLYETAAIQDLIRHPHAARTLMSAYLNSLGLSPEEYVPVYRDNLKTPDQESAREPHASVVIGCAVAKTIAHYGNEGIGHFDTFYTIYKAIVHPKTSTPSPRRV